MNFLRLLGLFGFAAATRGQDFVQPSGGGRNSKDLKKKKTDLAKKRKRKIAYSSLRFNRKRRTA